MICGNLKEITIYKGLSKNLDEVINYLISNDLSLLDEGTHTINEHFKIIRSSYIAKPIEDCSAEMHKIWVDLQLVLKGEEGIGYASISNHTAKMLSEDKAKDFYKMEVEDECILKLKENDYALVFPVDIHRPKIKTSDSKVEKIVIKFVNDLEYCF